MGFKLEDYAAPLDYDLGTATVDGEQVRVTGRVPEPSSNQVNEFMAGLSRLTSDALGLDENTDEDDESHAENVARKLEKLTAEQLNQVTDRSLDLLAAVTSGRPSRDELVAVGHRARQVFLGWMVGELTDPEGSKPATNTSQRAPSNAASTT